MSLFFDVSIVIMFFLFVYFGYKQGLLRSLIGLIGAIFAISIATHIAGSASKFIYNQFIREYIINKIRDILSTNTGNNISLEIGKMFPLISGSISSYQINNVIKNTTGDVAVNLSNLFAPVITNLTKNILVFILFIILMTFVGIIAKTVSKVTRLPGLRQIDGLLGGIFGAVKFLVVIFVFVLLIQFVCAYYPNSFISSSTVDSTYVLKHIYNNNPVLSLTNF